MNQIRRSLEKILSFSSEQLLLLTLLSGLAFLLGIFGTWIYALATGLYVGSYGSIDLAFEFFWGGLLWIPSGFLLLKIQHRF